MASCIIWFTAYILRDIGHLNPGKTNVTYNTQVLLRYPRAALSRSYLSLLTLAPPLDLQARVLESRAASTYGLAINLKTMATQPKIK